MRFSETEVSVNIDFVHATSSLIDREIASTSYGRPLALLRWFKLLVSIAFKLGRLGPPSTELMFSFKIDT